MSDNPRGRLLATLPVVILLAALTACLPAEVTRLSGLSGDDPASRPLSAADGLVPPGESLSPFADVPAITGLEPALRRALQDAAREAAGDGVTMHVSTGWRSAAYQQELYDEAVVTYGSALEASRHVLPADRSAHVSGRAVDVGPTDAMSWMAQHGADFGLCQTYANEMWHFELAVAAGGTCPAPAVDASAG